MGRNFLIIMVFMGIFSCMATGLRPSASSPRSFDNYTQQSGTGSKSRSDEPTTGLDGNAVALDRSPDGHFYADVEINGATVTCWRHRAPAAPLLYP